MSTINISDDDINYKSSKWLLEEFLLQGCNRFVYKEFECKCELSASFKCELKNVLSAFNEGEHVLDTFFYNTDIAGQDREHFLNNY
ncbi:hypothetical protein [Motilimonas eburnea]|uniref:hypothetical protein n=1 Tax=Motilimonas eburnea TaxID=1737488 RepID=UPI001E2ED008|nr:hypothetical protein [Motilimonas eburnea]MCE2573927.1 hypothetical protein [Motilimonas eburnea]